MLTKKIPLLIQEAAKAMKNAYVPITRHKVGAALLTEKGNMYIGSNVQSVISGLGTCAERAAVDSMVAHGEYKIKAICVVSKKQIHPCGACLQYLAEFSEIGKKDILIIMADVKKHHHQTTVRHLLPHIYGPKESKKSVRSYLR